MQMNRQYFIARPHSRLQDRVSAIDEKLISLKSADIYDWRINCALCNRLN